MQDKESTSAVTSGHDFENGRVNVGTKLVIDAIESFNYAAWQNAVPVLRRLVIDNTDGPELSTLTVELSSSSNFANGQKWTIDRVRAGEKLPLKNVDCDISAEYLNGLDEAERGVLTFRLVQKGITLHEVSHVIRVLARDEWGGMGSMGELLPAFVTPNEPALAILLRSAGTLLGQHGYSTALDGYQSGDPNRAYMLAASLWSAVAGRQLIYAVPPGSFEQVGQKTRRIGTVLTDGLATCLDSSLLLASGLEAMGLNSVLIMTEGHCFAGVWLVNKTFQRPVEQDCGELRKAVTAKEFIVFETTLVTHRPAARFPDAIHTANQAIAEGKDREFVAAIDVARARMSQVRPLASHVVRQDPDADEYEAGHVPLPASPGLEIVRSNDTPELPQTPAGRIERWQRKLLDLSLRNRLLNFTPSKQTVPILCPDLSRLEDLLAAGGKMKLVSLDDANPRGQRDADLHQKRTQKDLDQEFAKNAFDRKEIACPIEQRDLDVRLTALFRKVRADLSEGGSNTLYLAVGFLRWKQKPDDERIFRAPLLLVPVTLTRRSASSAFHLSSHEDDVQFNATLAQMLKKDFDCDLSAFESNLPTDDSGVDVQQVLTRVRQAIRDVPGFEVIEEAAIAPFSFSKYLMWKDMVDRVGQLADNRVVRHLIHDPDKAFQTAGVGTMPQPHEIDRRYTPQDLVHPLPADSSQLAAVMAASEGHDFVIVGPPGTGKSQTIANIIAQCLAVKKTVLFVAEKTAALDVVYRRLREHGLGDCCVELHSNKAERKRFLDQLQNSWKNRRQADASDWVTINEQLRVRRDQLNEYVACIHHQELNGWTVYRAMGECVRGRELTTPRLVWPAATQHDSRQYTELREAVAELGSTYGAVPAEAKRLAVKSKDWSMAWETAFLETCRQLETASDALTVSLRRLKETFDLPFEEDIPPDRFTPIYRLAQVLARPNKPSAEILSCTQLDVLKTRLDARSELVKAGQLANESLDAALREFCRVLGMPQSAPVSEGVKRQLYRLSNELVRAKPPLAELVFHERLEQCVQALADRPALLQSRDDSITALQSRSFNPVLIDRIPLDELETQWNKAVASFWPLSITRKNETKKRLAGYMTAGAVANPDVDLPLLFEYRANRASLNENLATMELPANLLNEVKKDATSLDSHITAAKRLREVISSTGLSIGAVRAATKGSLKSLVLAASQLYPPGREVERLQAELKQSLADLGLSADLQAVVMRDPHALDQEILSALSIRETAIASGMAGDRLSQMLHVLHDAPEQLTREVAAEYCRSAKIFQSAWTEYAKQASTLPAAGDSKSIAKDAAQAVRHVLSNRTALRLWTAWLGVQSRARKLGLDSFVEAMETGALLAKDAVSRFELAFARWWLPLMIDRRKPLQKFQKVFHEDAIQQYRLLDDHARKAAEHRVRSGVLHDLPPADQAPRKSELGLLRHQMTLKRPSKSIREMISGMPGAFGKLAPCLLMSPLSIAQYLPVDQALFDVVVFDEASQIATWDAIGAIARGKQTIIVGDPKQLPPTNYFGKADNDEDNAELSDHEKDLESILDEAQASGLPTLQLNWHYRSRHESLIAFSNWNYYGNHLVTFPAAESLDRGVSLQYVAGAIYDRGKSRTNRKEAEAIVAALVERMKRCLTKPPHQRLTYGVVTFNTQQQELILDLLDDAQRSSPDLEWYFADDRIEPTFVKNLENVQGDERDVMMFSIAFGHDAAGKFPVDFGAINRDGGERRLNVAITRARQELVVFSSFLPDQLRAERSNARGVRDLKSFLEYADKGPEAMVARTDGSLGGFESPLEEAIASALEKRGWNIDTQVGVSGFRIDLGVVHPDKPGAYLAGIECDGMTYHRSAMARDRDKTRQQVLENLGWTIARVWSTDWWYDSEGAIEHLHAKLNEVLALSRQEQLDASQAALDEQADPESASEPPVVCDETSAPIITSFSDFDFSDDIERLDKAAERSPLIAGSAPAAVPMTEKNWYRRAILDDAVIHQTRFFDADYSDSLRCMAHAVLNAQSPILDDALAREVARAHGYNRTGYKIKQRVLEVLSDVTTTVESVGTFLWAEKTTLPAVPFRYPSNENERRSIDEIAHEELLGLLRERPELATSDDPALALAREMGLARLARSARERLEQVVEAHLGDS